MKDIGFESWFHQRMSASIHSRHLIEILNYKVWAQITTRIPHGIVSIRFIGFQTLIFVQIYSSFSPRYRIVDGRDEPALSLPQYIPQNFDSVKKWALWWPIHVRKGVPIFPEPILNN
ncbi:hypothetical protein NPIL_362671 [Nephila pilipes]|uniref:Uncharacterized protein n=1 Tax=Nephila pilipes TaxID=299642 RepID=A0A8X6P295_NEPPI|nr:hypothetical protein NPIL_362671 [Nephila pilipes]